MAEETMAERFARLDAVNAQLTSVSDKVREAYQNVELRVVDEASRLARKIEVLEEQLAGADQLQQARLRLELAQQRAESLRILQERVRLEVLRLTRSQLAEGVVNQSAQDGAFETAQTLRTANVPAGTPFTSGASQAVAAVQQELANQLGRVNNRILRYADDAYRAVIGGNLPGLLLGVDTFATARRRATEEFLSQGVTGFVDSRGRKWGIGTYAEMATRTAARNAREGASLWQQKQANVNLVVIRGSYDACDLCSPWIGRVLSTDGSVGNVTARNFTTGEDVTVVVEGTLDGARAAGWGHPNCRDTAQAYLPGYTVAIPQEYNPEAESLRKQQRALEVRLRKAKLDVVSAQDDVSRQQAKRVLAQRKAKLKEFTDRTGRRRNYVRESATFDTKAAPPRVAKVPAVVARVEPKLLPDVEVHVSDLFAENDPAKRDELLKSVFEGRTFGDGYTLKHKPDPQFLKGYIGMSDRYGAEFSVMKGKKKVGTVYRYFHDVKPYGDKEGYRYVTHEVMKLQEAHRGKGFSSDFSAFSEKWYKDSKIKHIQVHAALENGAYTWAKAGYTWNTDNKYYVKPFQERIWPQISTRLADVEKKLKSAKRGAEAAKLAEIRKRLDTLDLDKVPQPFEIANFPGEIDGKSIGRAVLDGAEWYGVKFLS